MNKCTLDRWAPIGASVATLGTDLSSIPAEPNVKFKGNRHVYRVNGQFNYSERCSVGLEYQMDKEEKLVETIREYTCLWKVNAKEYKGAIAKENAWKEVARKVSKIIYY